MLTHAVSRASAPPLGLVQSEEDRALTVDLSDIQRALGRIEGEMVAHRGEQARLAGQFAATMEEGRKAREAIDNRMLKMQSEWAASVTRIDHRLGEIEVKQSEHDGAKHVAIRVIEWVVMGAIGIASAVAIWMADKAGGH